MANMVRNRNGGGSDEEDEYDKDWNEKKNLDI